MKPWPSGFDAIRHDTSVTLAYSRVFITLFVRCLRQSIYMSVSRSSKVKCFVFISFYSISTFISFIFTDLFFKHGTHCSLHNWSRTRYVLSEYLFNPCLESEEITYPFRHRKWTRPRLPSTAQPHCHWQRSRQHLLQLRRTQEVTGGRGV